MNRLLSCLAAAILLLAWSGAQSAAAQSQRPGQPLAAASTLADNAADHEVQLYLLVGSNQAGEKGGLPASIDQVAKQLKTAMPFSSYRVAATFINRVKNGGKLDVKGVAGTLFPISAGPNTPAFYEFSLIGVKNTAEAAGQPSVEVGQFHFALRLPVITSSTPAGNNGAGLPVFIYESTGINTQVSLRENTPTVIGTMTTGRGDESFILVLVVR